MRAFSTPQRSSALLEALQFAVDAASPKSTAGNARNGGATTFTYASCVTLSSTTSTTCRAAGAAAGFTGTGAGSGTVLKRLGTPKTKRFVSATESGGWSATLA